MIWTFNGIITFQCIYVIGPRFLFDPKMLRAFSIVKVFMHYTKENVNDFSSILLSWENNYFLYFEAGNTFKGFWYYIPIFRAIAHTQFNNMFPLFHETCSK